jgi:hypothetical protein
VNGSNFLSSSFVLGLSVLIFMALSQSLEPGQNSGVLEAHLQL